MENDLKQNLTTRGRRETLTNDIRNNDTQHKNMKNKTLSINDAQHNANGHYAVCVIF